MTLSLTYIVKVVTPNDLKKILRFSCYSLQSYYLKKLSMIHVYMGFSTVLHRFATFHAKRGSFHIISCLRSETKSIIVLFHMGFQPCDKIFYVEQYNYRPRFAL